MLPLNCITRYPPIWNDALLGNVERQTSRSQIYMWNTQLFYCVLLAQHIDHFCQYYWNKETECNGAQLSTRKNCCFNECRSHRLYVNGLSHVAFETLHILQQRSIFEFNFTEITVSFCTTGRNMHDCSVILWSRSGYTHEKKVHT